jgi:subtilase family serine protease
MRSVLVALAATVIFSGLIAVNARADQSARLVGNHPLQAETEPITANADPAQPLTMEVRFAIRNRAELDKLLAEQQDPNSPNYHKWLATGEFDKRFGATPAQVDAVSAWLRSQGFSIVSASAQSVEFSGTVDQAQRTFSVQIAKFGNGKFFANTSDPYIPAQFTGVIGAIEGLDNMRQAIPASRQHLMRKAPGARPTASHRGSVAPQSRWSSSSHAAVSSPDAKEGGVTAFGPKDLWTFYNEKPLIDNHVDGTGNCVAVVGTSDFHGSDVSQFNSTFGLPASQITRKVVGTNPGIVSGDGSDIEALLDLEYSHAAAPGAKTFFYFGNDLVNAISAAVNGNACGSIGISFTICASSNSFFTGTMDPIFAKAASQGQSVFISSGDEGAAGVVFNAGQGACLPGNSRNVNELSADPNVTSVGGTGFTPNFDGSGNDVGSVAESVWNDSGIGASGGGASAAFAKPSFQNTGTPADGARDVPDVSLLGSPVHPGVFLADDCGSASNCNTGVAGIECCIGGTSLSVQVLSGFSQALAQLAGGRLGNINPRLYDLANQDLAGNGFRDVTSGNNSFNGVTGFSAVTGYDQATGWGTLDLTTFASAFGNVPAGPLKTMPVNPNAKNFGKHVVGKTYAAKKITLINPKKNHTVATIQSVTLQDGSVFHIDPTTTTCVASFALFAGHNCKVGITFSPTMVGGPQTDTLIITDTSTNSPQMVPLTGIGK